MTWTVQILGASKWYGPVIGVNEVDLNLSSGITGLLGPNGAGKSTLMKLIVGLLRPSLGEVRVLGQSFLRRPWVRRQIGFSPEVDGFHEEMAAEAFVRAMARLSGLGPREARERTEESLRRVGMEENAEKPLGACSKGMRQRIKIAQALVHDPQVLVLDEPLSGIDPMGREDLLELFRSLGAAGKTLLISTHIIHEVEAIADRIVLMARGRILASGTVASIRDLLDEHPLLVRIGTARARHLSVKLMELAEVVGVEVLAGGADLVAKVRRPEPFFRALPSILLEEGLEVDAVEPLDASAEAIFNYLVGGGGAAAP